MWDVSRDWSAKEDLNGCQNGDRDKGEDEGVEDRLEIISLDIY